MNISALKTAATQLVGKTRLLGGKHAPAILTGIGVIGVVGTVVLAARATLNLEKEVDSVRKDVASVNDRISVGRLDESEKGRELFKAYSRGAVRIGKLYAPSVLLGTASVGCILGGHKILSRRNVALTAAYKAIETSYNNYRGAVREDQGEEKDHEYFRKASGEYETVVETDEETGEKKAVLRTNLNHSQYARFFDEYNNNWRGEDNQINLLFLKSVQNYANDKLLETGHIFLNEVYERLGFPATSTGALVGWVIKPGEDNHVDFGIFNKNSQAARDFVNGYEKSILLDFNVDGVMYDKI